MTRKTKGIVLITIVVIILFHLVNNYIWLQIDNTYLLYDSHSHFLFSLKAFDEIKKMHIPLLSNILTDFGGFRWHGIFVGYVTAPFYFIFGTSQDAGVMINSTIFLVILVLSTYGIGKRLISEKAGLLAAFIVTMYPLVFNQLRIYMLDLPLTSMVTLSVYLLLLTNNFKNKKYSLFFAISVGLGMLTKFNFVGFIAGPLFLVLYKVLISIRKERNLRLIQKRNMLIIFLVTITIALPFYLLRFWEVLTRIYGCSWLYAVRYYPRYSPFSLIHQWASIGRRFIFWCIKDIINNSVSFLFFCVFLISLPIFIIRKFDNRNILLLWIFIPIFCLSLFFHYPAINRYMMPFMPAIAIISGIGIIGIKYTKLRKAIISLIIIFGCFQYFAVSYNISFFPARIDMPLPNNIFGIKNNCLKGFYLFNRNMAINYRNDVDNFSYPSEIDWKSEELLREIIRSSNVSKQNIIVYFIDAIPQVYEPIAYRDFIGKQVLDIYLNSLAEEERYKDQDSPLDFIIMADYVIITKDEKFNEGLPKLVKERIKEARQLFGENISRFNLIREFRLQDGSVLLVFKNKKDYIKIAKGPLELYFRDGVTRLYYNGLEISRLLGLKVSFKSQRDDYSSMQASWDASKQGDFNMAAIVKWKELPVSQKWELEISDSNNIEWKIWMNVTKKIAIKDVVFSLMLSGKYTEWINLQEIKNFSNKNILAYKKIILPESMQKYIGVCGFRRARLPKVVFKPLLSQFKLVPTVRWKKDLRVLGFATIQKDDDSFLLPGEYNFLSAEIKIGEDKI